MSESKLAIKLTPENITNFAADLMSVASQTNAQRKQEVYLRGANGKIPYNPDDSSRLVEALETPYSLSVLTTRKSDVPLILVELSPRDTPYERNVRMGRFKQSKLFVNLFTNYKAS